MPLHIIIGSMFASKTETAIGIGRKQRAIGKKVLFINNKLDDRYSKENKVYSHNGTIEECIKVNQLSELSEELINNDTIIIEESQFFTDLLETFIRWNNDGLLLSKMFVVTGLSSDYLMNKIGQTIDLIPMADSVQKLSGLCSICKDGTEGPFTKMIRDNNDDRDNIIVGGSEKFICVCREHYYEHY